MPANDASAIGYKQDWEVHHYTGVAGSTTSAVHVLLFNGIRTCRSDWK